LEALVVHVEVPDACDAAVDLVKRLQKAGIVKGAMPVSDQGARAEIWFEPIQSDAVERVVKEARQFAASRGLKVINGRGSLKTISLKGQVVKEVKLTTLMLHPS
jgi:hypothetical protein